MDRKRLSFLKRGVGIICFGGYGSYKAVMIASGIEWTLAVIVGCLAAVIVGVRIRTLADDIQRRNYLVDAVDATGRSQL